MKRTLPALAALALAAAPLTAQAPRITEQGDPSIRADTIYRLAARPEDYPDESSILLLDDGVVIINEDGTGSRTYRYVAQVLTQDAVEGWAENTFSWDGKRERFRLNWARVIGPDGRVISDRPSHDQENLAPVSEVAPVYTDQRIRRITMGGVVPGVIVDYSFTTETVDPILPGDFLAGWSIHTGRPVRRSRYILEIPAGMTPRIREENLNFARRTRTAGGRVVYDWTTREVPKVEGEPFMADSNGVFMSIAVSGPVSWADVARWYHGLSAERYQVTPAIEARLAEVVRDARSLDDSLRALHRWVAQDIRYVSLSLGIGGYQPRMPADVFQTQYGDCKDKATLFIALARHMGVRAYPVLLNSRGGNRRDMPSVQQFNHMIAAVERPDGGYTYLDLTADLIPYGLVSPGYQGEMGLLVHEDGRGEEVTFPQDPPSANRAEVVLAGELDADGRFRGSLTRRVQGGMQYGLRNSLSAQITTREREELTRITAGQIFEGAVGDSIRLFDGKDLNAEPRTELWLHGGRAATRSGQTLILTVPFPNGSTSQILAELQAAREPRRFPIDVAAVIGPIETVSEFRLRLPEGYQARLPERVHAESAFGSYTAEYTQEGRDLRVVRRVAGSRGTLPPERVGDLVAWLQEMNRDDVRFIVVEPTP